MSTWIRPRSLPLHYRLRLVLRFEPKRLFSILGTRHTRHRSFGLYKRVCLITSSTRADIRVGFFDTEGVKKIEFIIIKRRIVGVGFEGFTKS